MKTSERKYRFCLQWGSETFEKKQAGDLLECLGNRKSEFIITAISSYLYEHPDIIVKFEKLKIVVQRNYTKGHLEDMIRSILKENVCDNKLSISLNQNNQSIVTTELTSTDQCDTDIENMLKNIDLFT